MELIEFLIHTIFQFLKVVKEFIENNSILIATLINLLLAYFNYQTIKLSTAQLEETRRQFEESKRANIEVEIFYENRTLFGIRLVNQGNSIATDVTVDFDNEFLNSLNEQQFKDMLSKNKNKSCIIGVDKHHDFYIGSNELLNNPNKKPIQGIVKYISNNKEYANEFFIDIQNYVTFFSISNKDDKLEQIKEINKSLKGINTSLKNIGDFKKK